MNLFLFAADAMFVATIVALPAVLMGSVVRRVIAAGIVTFFAAVNLMLLSVAFDRADFADLAITLALLAFGGSLSYAYVLERWL